ncbi:MAG: GNAT family N-acetyltransferase [Ferruginibacter sp.]
MLKLNFQPFPQLTTSRLILRPIKKTDAHDIFHLRSDEAVMKYLDKAAFTTIDEATELITKIENSFNSNEGINWGMTLKEDDRLFGTIGFWKIDKDHHRAEIGYMMKKDFHGKGLMQEAMEVALKYCFQKMKIHSVEANVNPLNAASIKILEKNNFVKEAYFRENYYYNGKFLDSAIYSLLTPIK